MIKLLLTVAVAASAFAQMGMPGIAIGPEPSLGLRQYLDLTNEQVVTIVRLNGDLSRFQIEKFRRQAQVTQEIQQETQKETLDAMAIGVRYVELEAIRREITAEQQRIARQVQAVLTPAQRTKVQALQDVVRTYPVACEALANNLMAMPAPTAISQVPSGITGSIGAVLLGTPACSGAVIRTGDFNFTAPAN